MIVNEIRTGTYHSDLVQTVCRNETRLVLDDVRLALDDAGPERQSDGDVRAVDTDVVIGRKCRVIARDARLDRNHSVPWRWCSR